MDRPSPGLAPPPADEPPPPREAEPPSGPSRRPSAERTALLEVHKSRVLGRAMGTAGVLILAVVAVVVLGRRVKNAPNLPKAVMDSVRAVQRAESIATFAPVPTTGWVKLNGDLPDDAVIWLDDQRVRGRVFPAGPGRHRLQIISDEFEPWQSAVRVKLGDTLTVEVELVLIQSRP